MTPEHTCKRAHEWCCCGIMALEPNEDCPRHGSGPWPPRCDICGRFLVWEPVEVGLR